MTADDLAAFSPEWVQPISIDYRGWTIYELPPNSAGHCGARNAQHHGERRLPLHWDPFSPVEMHKRIEAMKLAYADVRGITPIPAVPASAGGRPAVESVREKTPALIDPNKANCNVPNGDPVGSNTTYLTVVDKEGNIASWIQSVYAEFGSGSTAEGMEFDLQNRGALFSLEPGIPTYSRAASVHSTPSFRHSWSGANGI